MDKIFRSILSLISAQYLPEDLKYKALAGFYVIVEMVSLVTMRRKSLLLIAIWLMIVLGVAFGGIFFGLTTKFMRMNNPKLCYVGYGVFVFVAFGNLIAAAGGNLFLLVGFALNVVCILILRYEKVSESKSHLNSVEAQETKMSDQIT